MASSEQITADEILREAIMEEMLGNVAGARNIFEQWMKLKPDQQGWLYYVKFELRYGEVDRARCILSRCTECHPHVSAWIRFATFEISNGSIPLARSHYNRAVGILSDDEDPEELFVAFAELEEMCKETGRARFIQKYVLDHIQEGQAEKIHKKFVAFEQKFGASEEIEVAFVIKRRIHYENEVRKNLPPYDAWFDYIRFEGNLGDRQRIEGVYERAIKNPPAQEKRYWQRYIYLWISYALYEEFAAKDVDCARTKYSMCVDKIPHEKFSFTKIWLMAAQFELRQENIDGARSILEFAINAAQKDKIFKKYIEIEFELGNIERCKEVYGKYLERLPDNCYAWKAYIDFDKSEGEYERTRAVYERLLNRTKHLKVWISYAKFEASAMEKGLHEADLSESEHKPKCIQRARVVFERALSYFRTSAPELREERKMLLDEWLNMESSFGALGDAELVLKKLPKKVQISPNTYDHLFPEEIEEKNRKIVAAAHSWKSKMNRS